MLSNLLIYRVLIANLVAVAAVIWAFTTGAVTKIVMVDPLMSAVIVLVFLVGMYGFWQRVKKTSTALNDVKNGRWVNTTKFAIKSSFIGSVSVWLVTLGLLANIWGFYVAVDGLNLSGGGQDALNGIDQMLNGMKMAFGMSYLGTALGLWMAINYQMLRTANGLLRIDSADLWTKQQVSGSARRAEKAHVNG